MRQYLFRELSELAKSKAICDYLEGWCETHGENDMGVLECYEMLLDSNEVYHENGEVVVDQWD